MNKKILLIGFTVAILLAIPLTLGLLSTQQKVTTKAQKSSTLSFSQLNGSVTVGQKFNLDILLDPGQNQISFVKMVISYNPAYLSVANGGGFVQVGSNQYSNQFTVTLDGPTYDETSNKCTGNTCNMTISMGINPQSGIPLQGAQTTIASIAFNPISAPPSGSTNVSFAAGTQVLSLASADQPSENVLSSSPPTTLQIVGPTPTLTPQPTSGGGGGGSATPTNTPAPTSGGGGGGGTSPTSSAAGPACNSLTADNTSTASAPLSSIFTVTGSSSTSTVNKVTFNFGDGTVQDVTSGGGLGTASINAQINHTFQTNGVFTATATLTDANGATSTPSSCSQTITVGSVTNTPTSGSAAQPTAQPTIPSTGPGEVIVGAGIIGAILAVAGVALFIGAL